MVVTSVWSFDISSVGTGPKDGYTQISMRESEGLWHKTSATVVDVHRAVANARTLFYASEHSPTKRRRA